MLPESLNGPTPIPDRWRQDVDVVSARVLVVANDHTARSLLAGSLADAGLRIAAVSSAADALAQLRASPWDLLLCDADRSAGDSVALARSVAERHPALPVLLVGADHPYPEALDELPCASFERLPDPYDVAVVAQVVRRSLDRCRQDRRRLLLHDTRILLGPLRALAAAVDAKQQAHASHSARVAEMACELGADLELDEDELRFLELAAIAHDIGKVCVPDALLNKPGRLTPDEWEMMREHPQKGAAMVGDVQELAYVAEVIRHHHEHLDGHGYPDGLKGESIPLLSRIIAVADALEAMTTDRPYRSRLTVEDALAELRRWAGRQFDPYVVLACARRYGR